MQHELPYIRRPVIDLGVNIDHVATLRNARGTVYPDPIRAALMAEEAGADCHHAASARRPPPYRDADVEAMRPHLKTRMNLECAVTAEMLDIACRIQPHDVCLVPEKRQELTTEGGLDVAGHFDAVQAACGNCSRRHPRSLFIDPDAQQIQAAAEAGAPVIELHTGRYAEAHRSRGASTGIASACGRACSKASQRGLKVNAGHGLHYTNVQAIAAIADIAELNIGHAIVAHAIFAGWENAVREMKAIMVVRARLEGGSQEMIYGIGTDIIQIRRVAAALARNGDRFAEKVLGAGRTAKLSRAPGARAGARHHVFSPRGLRRRKHFRKRSASACACR